MDLFLDHEAARRELVRGRALVSQLRTALQGSPSDGQTTNVLLEEISRYFTRALDALSSKETLDLETAQQISSSSNTTDRTLGSRRREYSSVQKILCAKPFEDGRLWKKYGQKNIIGAKFPRSYFKCSQRKDQGCQAIKQVQQTEGDPPLFLVSYIGQHTCTNTDVSSPPHQCFLSFGSDCSNNEQVQNWSLNQDMLPILQTLPELVPTTTQISTTGTNYVAHQDLVTVGVASEMISPISPTPLDTDSMVSLIDSVAGFYYDDDVFFKHP